MGPADPPHRSSTCCILIDWPERGRGAMTRDEFLAQAFPTLMFLLQGFHRDRPEGCQDWRSIVREGMGRALPATNQSALYESVQVLQMNLDEDYLARLTGR